MSATGVRIVVARYVALFAMRIMSRLLRLYGLVDRARTARLDSMSVLC
jgi:hypothetical protein